MLEELDHSTSVVFDNRIWSTSGRCEALCSQHPSCVAPLSCVCFQRAVKDRCMCAATSHFVSGIVYCRLGACKVPC